MLDQGSRMLADVPEPVLSKLPRGIANTIPQDLVARPGLAAADNAHRLTEQFQHMVRRGGGWTGGDGAYSLQIGDRTIWAWGDTYLGGTLFGKRFAPPDLLRQTFVRHSLSVQDGSSFRTIANDFADRFRRKGEWLRPPEAPAAEGTWTGGDWYWPAGMAHTDSGVQLLLTRFRAKEGNPQWAWQRVGTDVATLDPKTLDLLDIKPMVVDDTTSWGAALMREGETMWMYGAADDARHGGHVLTVARTRANDLRTPWEYLTNDGSYSNDAAKAVRLPFTVSPQFSALPKGDGVEIVSQRGFEPVLHVLKGDRPDGGFALGATKRIPLPAHDAKYFTYNSVVHPQFSDDASWVVSTNFNRVDGKTAFEAGAYAPRFAAVPKPQ